MLFIPQKDTISDPFSMHICSTVLTAIIDVLLFVYHSIGGRIHVLQTYHMFKQVTACIS